MKSLRQQQYNQQKQLQMLISICTLIVLIEAKPSAIYSYPLDDAIPNELLNIDSTPTRTQYDEVAQLLEHVHRECLTGDDSCEEAVSMRQMRSIEHHLRVSAEPCVDFHQYACGNWPIVHDNATTMMDLGEQRVTQRYADLFAQAEQQQHNAHAHLWQNTVYQKLLQYYQVCESNATSQQLNLQGYYTQIAATMNWQQMHWLQVSALLGRFGYAGHLLKVDVLRHNVSSYHLNVQTIFKKQQSHVAPKVFDFNAQIYNILSVLTSYTHEQLTEQFSQLESNLQFIANQQNDTGEEVWLSYAELQQRIPAIDWQAYFSTLLERQLPAATQLQVDEIATLSTIADYLNNANQQILTLYILTGFLTYLADQPHVPLALHAATQRHQCIRHMRKVLYLPMLYLYEQAYYAQVRPASDRLINTLYQQLKEEFSRTLAANKMNFSADIIEYLQLKLSAIRLNLGNLPQNLSDSYYVQYVEDLQWSNNFYGNHLHALQHFYRKQFQFIDSSESAMQKNAAGEIIWTTFNLHNPTMADEIDATPYYYCIGNIIIMPYAYLQQPFYDYRFWSVLLYGDLANTLGHELLHPFDSALIEYDYQGNMNTAMYEAIAANELYKANLECVQQGTTYTRERIADISGTRLALNTFMRDQHYRRDNGRLYFLQFAQFFCGKTADRLHDDNSQRLNYALQQTPEFAEVYQCASGSPMNPHKRCELW